MNPNQDTIAYWNGIGGERWTAYQDKMDLNFAPLSDAVLAAARVQSGERVLDIGCGCGATTLALAQKVGAAGRVLGVDVSRPMLARARERGAAVSNIAFVEADASIDPLPEVDLLFSRLGVMFFADPHAAFEHLHGALSAEGRLAFLCFRSSAENEWVKVATDAMVPHLPAAPPPDPAAPGPFAFADRKRVEEILSSAGFSAIELTPHDVAINWTRSPDVAVGVDFFVNIGPPSRRLEGLSEEVMTRVRASLATAFAPYQQAAGLIMRVAVWIVTAAR